MRKVRTAQVSALAILLIVFGFPLTTANDAAGGLRKENLDLPFDASAAENEEEEEAPEIVVFYGQQYEADGVFFSCDCSGSMRGEKFKRLQNEVIKNVSAFSERVEFGIVFFAGDVVKFPLSGRPAQATSSMKSAALAMVMSASLRHGTCTKPALLACLTYAQQSTAKRKLIIHLSDGLHRCNGYDPTRYGEETLTEVRQHNSVGAKINSICIGPTGQADEQWMRRLAVQNGGTFARIVE
jgi:hypothetical protein